uniref:Uncharacterized protein n=1 Tax=Setaria viridis TaxID=4556 RepID=A0A4U6SY22_SETVI|nr:hypothetical protein SEVIR_9G224450v2 [Setaria viridis]
MSIFCILLKYCQFINQWYILLLKGPGRTVRQHHHPKMPLYTVGAEVSVLSLGCRSDRSCIRFEMQPCRTYVCLCSCIKTAWIIYFSENRICKLYCVAYENMEAIGWPAHDSSVSSVLFGPAEISIFSVGSDGKIFG